MSGTAESLETAWRNRVQSSADAKEARNNLEFHRKKMQEIHEDLKVAEAYEAELERRLNHVEDRLKPPIMRFTDGLNQVSGVDETLAEETVREVEDPSRIVSLVKDKASTMAQMTRSQLVGFVRTIINLRNCFLEEEITAGSDVMQGMAGSVLKHLARPSINWDELSDWEAKVLRVIIRDVEGIPVFVFRIVDQILSKTIRDSEAIRNGQQMDRN